MSEKATARAIPVPRTATVNFRKCEHRQRDYGGADILSG